MQDIETIFINFSTTLGNLKNCDAIHIVGGFCSNRTTHDSILQARYCFKIEGPIISFTQVLLGKWSLISAWQWIGSHLTDWSSLWKTVHLFNNGILIEPNPLWILKLIQMILIARGIRLLTLALFVNSLRFLKANII